MKSKLFFDRMGGGKILLCTLFMITFFLQKANSQINYRMNQNATILVEFCDLPGYWDVPGTTFELVSSCGNTGGIQVFTSTKEFRVESVTNGNWSFCSRAKYPNGTYGTSFTVNINVAPILVLPCSPNGLCDVQCFDDFSDFTDGPNSYYQEIGINPPVFFTGASGNSPNTVDIFKMIDGNKFLSFQYTANTNGGAVQEFVVLPLSSPIEPGSALSISFKALARRFSSGIVPQTPHIQAFGVNSLCATNIFPTPTCTTTTSLCASPPASPSSFCLLNAPTNLGIPINADINFSYDIAADAYSNLDFTNVGPVYWPNHTSQAINYIILMGAFENPIASGPVRFDIDDVQVLKHKTVCACTDVNNSFPIGSPNCANIDFSTIGFSNNTLTAACLSIEGKLTIDKSTNFTLDKCEAFLGEGAEIVIQNGSTLSLKGATKQDPTYLKGCTKLWKSITVQNGGTLDANFANIQDAQFAIKLEHGANLRLTNSVFDKNYIDLFTAPSTNVKTVSLKQAIAGNEFKCTSNLKAAYTGQVEGKTETWTFAAASINSTTGLDITGATNEVWDVRNGILTVKSVVSVKNINIHDLKLGGGNKGISATSFSNLTVENCTINKANYCVYVVNSDVSITKCPNLSTYAAASSSPSVKDLIGIFVQSNTNRKIIIKTNTIKAVANGISVNWTFPALAGSEVSDNSVTMFSGGTGVSGIFMNRCSKFNMFNNKVDDPTVGPTYIGLRMERCEFNTVALNKIYGLGIGLNLTGGNGNYYYSNTVSKNPSGQGTPVTGFSIGACTDKFCCNKVDNLSGDGFVFESTCIPTSFRQSKIFASLNGLHLTEKAKIGKQEDARNLWTGPFASGFGAKHEASASSFILLSQFLKCKPPIPQYFTGLGANMPALPSAWFQLSNNGGALGNCSDCPVPPISPDITIAFGGTEEEETLATDGYTGTNFDPSLTWMAHQRLFERLRENTSFMANSSVLQSFYTNKTPQAIGQYDLVGLALRNLISRDVSTQNQLSNQSETVSSNARILDSLVNTQQNTSAIAQQLFNSFNTWVATVSTLEGAQQSEKGNILLSNSMLSTGDVWLSNERTLNRITLEQEMWKMPLTDSTAIEEVKAIADQCPLLGGFPVYQARGIYRSIVSDASWDDSALCTSSQPHEGEAAKTKQAQWSVYPNPAGEFLVVVCPIGLKKHATFELFNLFGKLEYRQLMPLGQPELRINTANLPSGVYTYSILGETQRLATGKLIISHL